MKLTFVDANISSGLTNSFGGFYRSSIGWIEVRSDEKAITSLRFVETHHRRLKTHPLVDKGLQQIEAYFLGKRQAFDLPLAFYGTRFQQQVWRELLTVPFGETVSYKDIAVAIGNSRAVRAVGAANGKNPISLIAPCHRVIGADGSLTGYGGGLWRKEWLLRHESRYTNI